MKKILNFFCFLFIIAAGAGISCAAETPAKVSPDDAALLKAREDAGRLSFVEMLQSAKSHEQVFQGFCTMILENNLILALNEPPDKGDPSLSIRVLPTLNSDDKGIVLIFSSRETLSRAADKDGWKKNDEGFYDYIVIKGQALFKALHANGYKRMILDAGSPVSFPFDEIDLDSLAEGKIPPFRDHRQTS